MNILTGIIRILTNISTVVLAVLIIVIFFVVSIFMFISEMFSRVVGYEARCLQRILIKKILSLVFSILCRLNRIKLKVLGNVPQGNCVIVSNHQSMLDMFLFPCVLPNARMIAKREILYIPGVFMMQYAVRWIFIAREQGVRALKGMFREVDEEIKLNIESQIVIFSQGTRTAVSEEKRYMKGGYMMLYKKFKLPIVPAVLHTGHCVMNDMGVLSRFMPGTVILEFLPEITYDPENNLDAVSNEVASMITSREKQIYAALLKGDI